MNKLPLKKQAQIVKCLVEGNSIRGTVRLTGVSKNTITKLLVDLGAACQRYQQDHIRGLKPKRVQCDEIWAFCYSKAQNVPAKFKGQFGYGDVWTWVAIDADSKFVISWALGNRDANTATAFLHDLARRLDCRIQLTTDGHRAYIIPVWEVFGLDIDYAQLVKLYGPAPKGETRYSPGQCLGAKKTAVMGRPDRKHISTSYAERQNLTMRMSMRRFTRLTNAFSKKVENLGHAVSLHFMHYNFCRTHQSLRVTPAMAAGVTDRLWEVEDLVKLTNT